jgi:predicted nucleic acid-binding protein
MPRPTVYLETTIVSYLAARSTRDLVRAAQQQVTRDWWLGRERFELFISELVLSEASQGDPSAAAERLVFLNEIPLLTPNESTDALAESLIHELAIPRQAIRDAGHVALAATNGIDYLLTWNCRHLANLHQRGRIEQVCREHGFEPPLIGTPYELQEDEP